MARKYIRRTDERVPSEVDGIQVNRCANVRCEGFARDPIPGRKRDPIRDHYGLTGDGGKNGSEPGVNLHCRLCNTYTRILSNRAIAEEYARISLRAISEPRGCGSAACLNANVTPSADPQAFQKFGQTAAGAARWRCKGCGRTFTAVKSPRRATRLPGKTEEIFKLLINKSAMRRLCAIAGVHPKVLYHRIGLIHEACSRFNECSESRITDLKPEILHIAIDRQDHILAWASASNRNAVSLRAIASAETKTGYILDQHLNYDPEADGVATELKARAVKDQDQHRPFRMYGRIWLPSEIQHWTKANADLEGEFAPVRSAKGAMVRENYSLFAHVLRLRRWIDRAPHVQISLDREPNLDRAILLAYSDRVRNGTLDAFHVAISKRVSVQKKKVAIAKAENDLQELRDANPEMEDRDLIYAEIARQRRLVEKLPRNQRWIRHPMPTMNEPERAIMCLTDMAERPEAQMVWGFARAGLRSIDRYFMQVRRKISVLERPISVNEGSAHSWYGYNAYSPLVAQQLLDIFRVVYNYHLVGKDGKTPAQRLGLAAKACSLADILAA